MIKKFIFGKPIKTDAVVKDVEVFSNSELSFLNEKETDDAISFEYDLDVDDIVYGLGEVMGSINKRGGRYISFNTDTPNHTPTTPSLYATHNFLVIDGKKKFGIFLDNPGRIIFEVDYNNSKKLSIRCENKNFNLYLIDDCDSSYSITKEFLSIIGQSFIPPLWAFGFGQSRWGYRKKKDFDNVVKGYEKKNLPLDYICMDIDYMNGFRDFTINEKRFPNFKNYVKSLKDKNIHLVPIIDAGVKIDDKYSTYLEGVKNNYFCTNLEGENFNATVWPGPTHFPDFFKEDTRAWFGQKYKFLTDYGIEGFWNDMNEPSIFHSEYTAKFSKKKAITKDEKYFLDGKYCEYKTFFHNIDGNTVCHYDVHNVYGYFMTRAASEQLDKILDKRFLLFSRSSYIGAHRYAGIWTGDNKSTWFHLKQNVMMMPSLNMCGFLYSGADTGGFLGRCSRELLLRWLAFSLFTPLFRDHTALLTKHQECYKFKGEKDFQAILSLRYRLLPYIYSEFVKAVLNSDMYIKPLAFEYDDVNVRKIDDQLLVGDSIMVAPIVEKGKAERNVYLPEDMIEVKYDGCDFKLNKVEKGNHILNANLNEVVFFIRKGKLIPISKGGKNTAEVDFNNLELLGDGDQYLQYIDDGYTKDVKKENIRVLKKE